MGALAQHGAEVRALSEDVARLVAAMRQFSPFVLTAMDPRYAISPDFRAKMFQAGEDDPRSQMFHAGHTDPRLSTFTAGPNDPRFGTSSVGANDPRIRMLFAALSGTNADPRSRQLRDAISGANADPRSIMLTNALRTVRQEIQQLADVMSKAARKPSQARPVEGTTVEKLRGGQLDELVTELRKRL